MKYRRLGRTGLMVSEVIFGCGNVGGLLINGDPASMRTAVDGAIAAGVNWFDTAAQYGKGKSERHLGELLAKMDAKPHVSTKVRIDPADVRDMPGQIERSLIASLERLGLDSVDLLQLHNGIESEAGGRSLNPEQVLGAGGAIEGLERVREQGLTRHIGMTALGDTALCRDVIGSGRVETAQVYYNLLNPTAGVDQQAITGGQDFGGLIADCVRHDVGVIVIRALAAGVLATPIRHGRESIITANTDINEEERKARVVLEALGEKHGTPAERALRFVLSEPGVSCVDIGFENLTHIEEAVHAVELGALPSSAQNDLELVYSSNFNSA